MDLFKKTPPSYFVMVVAGETNCICVQEDEPKLALWRDICRQYYFHQDDHAKVVLDAYEGIKQRETSEITIEIGEMDTEQHIQPTLATLGLMRCPIAEHSTQFDTNLLTLEKVKNQIRVEFHAHASAMRYNDFNLRLQPLQSCHYVLSEQNAISVRPQEGYLRSQEDLDMKRAKLLRFLGDCVPNVGAHPFLHGLHRFLTSNMQSTTVVGWEVSDATFVESGGTEFIESAVSLLIDSLHCGHHIVVKNTNEPNHRIWYLDPYLSNTHIRRMLWLFPNMKMIEGRATGTEVPTAMERSNALGQHDEPPAWRKICVVL